MEDLFEEVVNSVTTSYRKKYEADEASDLYSQIELLRHDKICELIGNDIGISLGDVNQAEVFKELDLYGMTPDILIRDDVNNYVIYGDIAITRNTEVVQSSKILKYEKSIDIIETLFKVKQLWLIFSSDGMNCEQMMSRIEESGLERPNDLTVKNIIKCLNKSEVALNMIINNTRNIKEFYIIRRGKQNKFKSDLEGLKHKSVDFDNHEIKIMKSEEQLYEEIMSETKRVEMTFYDNGADSIMDAYNKIKFENDIMKERDIGNPYMFAGNFDEIEEKTNLKLVKDYILEMKENNTGESQFMLKALSNFENIEERQNLHIHKREDIINNNKTSYSRYEHRSNRMFERKSNNYIEMDMSEKLELGKKKKNPEEAPKSINSRKWGECISIFEDMIKYLMEESKKPPEKTVGFKYTNSVERNTSSTAERVFNECRRSRMTQMMLAMDSFAQRLNRTPTRIASKPRIFIPPNQSCIIVIPKGHQPTTSKNVEVPYFIIWRQTNPGTVFPESRGGFKAGGHYYYRTKLFRLNIDKINHWLGAFRKSIAATCSIVSANQDLELDSKRLFVVHSTCAIDIHQKTSEILDLFKYISWQPLADYSKLSDLIKEKFNMLLKTCVDVWFYNMTKNFILKLFFETSVKVPIITRQAGVINESSFGLTEIFLPSFINQNISHKNIESFINEVSSYFILRPKKLYGNQYMDKSFQSLHDREKLQREESELYGGWVFKGFDESPYPFRAKFAYSRDAIYHATKLLEDELLPSNNKIEKELWNESYRKYAVEISSLRGAVKSKEDRKEGDYDDLHSTAMDEALKYSERNKHDKVENRILMIGIKGITEDKQWEFVMSAKEQRGGGRPIVSPDIYAKNGLRCIEGPEMAIGKHVKGNILVSGSNKGSVLHETYRQVMTDAIHRGYNCICQVTEDQTKFSEEDNPRKYLDYLKSSKLLTNDIRALQYDLMNKIMKRIQRIHNVPLTITQDNSVKLIDKNGIYCTHGWPQGMLNHISTTVHAMADRWITHLWNKFNENKVIVGGVVHSDDSHYTIAASNKDVIREFSIFRNIAKKLFCLKMNDKKTYVSSYIGEMVSHWNVNGTISVPWIKTVVNSFNTNMYLSYDLDVKNAVSTIHQAATQGCPIPVLNTLWVLLQDSLITSYQVDKMNRNYKLLPISLGGLPEVSAFQLACHQSRAFNNSLFDFYKNEDMRNTKEYNIIASAVQLSLTKLEEKVKEDNELSSNYTEEEIEELIDIKESTDIVRVPKTSDMFSAITHRMPMRRGIKLTVKRMRELPYEDNGLSQLVGRVDDYHEMLGHIKGKSISAVYELASSKYSQSQKRMALQQSLVSTGEVWGIRGKNEKYDINGLHEELSKYPKASDKLVLEGMMDTVDSVSLVKSICKTSVEYGRYKKQTMIINKQPFQESRSDTIAPIRDALLYIINPSYYFKYSKQTFSIKTVRSDAERIIGKYRTFFKYYTKLDACEIILNDYNTVNKKKTWRTSPLNVTTTSNFYRTLYESLMYHDDRAMLKYSAIPGSFDSNVTYVSETISTIKSMELISYAYNYDPDLRVFEVDKKSTLDWLKVQDINKMDDETFKDWSWLMYKYENNDEYLKNWQRTLTYKQEYIKSQLSRMQGDKIIYYGDIDVICQYGGTIMRIKGERTNFVLTTNRININEMLTIMQNFVKYNFPEYSYKDMYNWGTLQSVWGNHYDITRSYLNFINKNETSVSSTQFGLTSLPLIINSRLSKIDRTYKTASRFRLNPNKIYKIEYWDFIEEEYEDLFSTKKKAMWRTLFSIRTNAKITPSEEIKILNSDYMFEMAKAEDLFRSGILEQMVSPSPKKIPFKAIKDISLHKSAGIGLATGFLTNLCLTIYNRRKNNNKKYNLINVSEYDKEDNLVEMILNDNTFTDVTDDLSKDEREGVEPGNMVVEDMDMTDTIVTYRLGTIIPRRKFVKTIAYSMGYGLLETSIKVVIANIYRSSDFIDFYNNVFLDLIESAESSDEVSEILAESLELSDKGYEALDKLSLFSAANSLNTEDVFNVFNSGNWVDTVKELSKGSLGTYEIELMNCINKVCSEAVGVDKDDIESMYH
nr:hypothetical protein [Leuven Bunya-like virus 2]